MNSNKERLVFMMYADTALEYFERVKERGAETEDEKMEILLELAKEGKMKSVSKTHRNQEQLLKDLAKKFRVLHIKKP